MKKLAITNATVVTGGSAYPNHAVLCEEGVICDVLPAQSLPASLPAVDAGGRWLVPGYIDLHQHGVCGHLADDGPKALTRIRAALPRFGVTAFLPTLTPGPREAEILARLAAVSGDGAHILGFFLEGHFLALTGAIRGMVPDHTLRRVHALRQAAAPYPAIFGISPELPDTQALLAGMTEGGTPAFITHTAASFEQTEAAIAAGARHATHFYDVFPYPGEQEPGVRGCGAVEAILADPFVSVDFILDGEHVHPSAVKMALACKGQQRVCLATDANNVAGLPPGVYPGLGGVQVATAYPGAPAREHIQGQAPGGLTGSGLTLDRAVRNAVRLLGISLPLAVRMASENPARVLGLEGRMGSISPGFAADFSLLDEALEVTDCYIGGVRRFDRGL